MISQIYDSAISRFGNSQGIRIPKKILDLAHFRDAAGVESIPVQIEVLDKTIIIRKKEETKNTLDYYLEGYADADLDRYDWGEPAGREIW